MVFNIFSTVFTPKFWRNDPIWLQLYFSVGLFNHKFDQNLFWSHHFAVFWNLPAVSPLNTTFCHDGKRRFAKLREVFCDNFGSLALGEPRGVVYLVHNTNQCIRHVSTIQPISIGTEISLWWNWIHEQKLQNQHVHHHLSISLAAEVGPCMDYLAKWRNILLSSTVVFRIIENAHDLYWARLELREKRGLEFNLVRHSALQRICDIQPYALRHLPGTLDKYI